MVGDITAAGPAAADVLDGPVELTASGLATVELTGRVVPRGGSLVRRESTLRANLADRSVRLLMMTFLGAQLADIATTHIALSRAGLVEANPLFRFLFHVLPVYADGLKVITAMSVAVLVVSSLRLPRSRHALELAAALSLLAPVLNTLTLLGHW
jgi:hypothetical protein